MKVKVKIMIVIMMRRLRRGKTHLIPVPQNLSYSTSYNKLVCDILLKSRHAKLGSCKPSDNSLLTFFSLSCSALNQQTRDTEPNVTAALAQFISLRFPRCIFHRLACRGRSSSGWMPSAATQHSQTFLGLLARLIRLL